MAWRTGRGRGGGGGKEGDPVRLFLASAWSRSRHLHGARSGVGGARSQLRQRGRKTRSWRRRARCRFLTLPSEPRCRGEPWPWFPSVDQGAGGFCGRQMLSGMIVTAPDFCGVFILLHSSLGVKGKGVIPKSPPHLVGRPHPNSAWTV